MGLLIRLMLLTGTFYFSAIKAQDYWEIVPTPDTAGIFCVLITDSNNIIIGGFGKGILEGGIHISADNGETWCYVNIKNYPTNYGVFTIKQNGLGRLIAGVSDDIYYSDNGGYFWDKAVIPEGSIGNFTELDILDDSVMFAGANELHYLYRSVDAGETWQMVFDFTIAGIEYVEGIAHDASGVIYVGTNNYESNQQRGIWKSENLGDSWEFFGMQGYCISDLAFDNNGILWAGTLWQGLFRFEANQQQWIQVLANRTVLSILIAENNTILLGCDYYPYPGGGVMISADNGQTFEYINSGLGGWVDDLAIDASGTVYAAQIKNADPDFLFKSTFLVSTDEKRNDISPVISIIPNPFNERTVFDLSSFPERNIGLTIRIYDINGNIIIQDEKVAGNYYLFEGKGLDAGIYFYQIKYENSIITGKLILAK